MSFTAIAERLDLSPGATSRLLHTLSGRGYVDQNDGSKLYELGLKFLELQGAGVGALRIAAEARPFLRDLMVATHERVHLALYRNGRVVYIDRVDTPETVGTLVPVGTQRPAHATSLGKALLSVASPDEVVGYIASGKLVPLTDSTITDPEAFRRELETTRLRGYAVESGESAPDSICIGAPIFDYTGTAIAAISIAGTTASMTPRMDTFAAAVLNAAAKISNRFGFGSGPLHQS